MIKKLEICLAKYQECENNILDSHLEIFKIFTIIREQLSEYAETPENFMYIYLLFDKCLKNKNIENPNFVKTFGLFAIAITHLNATFNEKENNQLEYTGNLLFREIFPYFQKFLFSLIKKFFVTRKKNKSTENSRLFYRIS